MLDHQLDVTKIHYYRKGEERLKDDVEKNTDTNLSSTGTEGDTQKQVHKKQQETVTVVSQKENNPPIITSSINGFIGNTGKEKKKKKSEFNTLQQLGERPFIY